MPQLFTLDDYEKCLSYPDGLYCTGAFDVHGDESNDVIRLIRDYSKWTLKHYNYSYIQRGVCITQTCTDFITNDLQDDETINRVYEACVNQSIWNNYGVEAKLTSVYSCMGPNKFVEKDVNDWIVLYLILFVVLMNILGTIYSVYFHKDSRSIPGHKILLMFALDRNLQLLKETEYAETRMKGLRFVKGSKMSATFLVILLHVSWLHGTGFTTNPHDFEKYYDGTLQHLLFHCTIGVQIFFVITSFLLVYNLQIKSEIGQITWQEIPKLLLYRWWRLTSSSGFIVLLASTWVQHIGTGPLWHMITVKSTVADCKKYWWTHLLYINNFNEDSVCLIHTWYLAAEFQLFALALILFIASKYARKTVLATVMLVGLAIPAINVWLYDLDAVLILIPEFYRFLPTKVFYHLYVHSYNNILPYLCGMIAGFVAYEIQKRKLEFNNIKVNNAISTLSLILMFAIMGSGTMFYNNGPRASMAVRLLYVSIHKLLFSITVGVNLVIMSSMKVDNYISKFLSWPGWHVPEKLSYIVYLVHISIIHILIGRNTQLLNVDFLQLFISHFGIITLSYVFALPYFLMVEAPFSQLLTILIPKHINKKILIKNEENGVSNGKKIH